MKIATNLFTPKPAPYCPSTRGLVSNMTSSNSTIVKMAKFPVVVILSPIALLLDLADAAARPFRKIEPLTFKEKVAIVANKSGAEIKKAASLVKGKASAAASKAKDFANEHPTFVKVTAATVATIGAAYLYKRIKELEVGVCPVKEKVCDFKRYGGFEEKWIDKKGSCVLKKIPPLRAPKKKANAITEFVKENPGTSTIGGLVTTVALVALAYFGFKKHQARKAAGTGDGGGESE